MNPRRPQTPQARARQLTDRLRQEARGRGLPVDRLRKQFVFALLFKRLFADNQDEWLLLGGNALLVRIGGGRLTQDIDLAHASQSGDPHALLEDLRAKAATDNGDGFNFELLDITTHDRVDEYGYGTRAHKIRARAMLGGTLFEPFSIDVTQRRHVEGPVDRVRPTPVIDDPALDDLPAIPVAPIENHMADKVCGMYERHKRDTPSTRWRDLADLVRVTTALKIDAERLHRMLAHEAERRRLSLPSAMVSPGPRWAGEYPRNAKTFEEFPEEFYALNASLAAAGRCLDPVLDGTRTRGTWDPARQRWEDPA
ncbi:nucleotidyl transferase AbiEii/AbiGii toxin family protein [Kytococcus sedentarius]|uniref:Nucleotidyl transferase AbiEii/AbiGii toxin family protein n=1 Tax=Kytococcus sedentarius (strain ATCC 14392 / DSM 20547 / JCM 11482 / CCUG 33030 / NBRC 15357 / NCTC 11040 / CCM 314 / 541) TaxID=478801 RepID=C7NM06_KYTSD|nr:nucleotidyl transferase AbiEii/AbiGii toxin family protein [Kytococcus sedentarius]ACV07255.1 protein of unknown function (DUF1814) [Kytococcus sedentarius DSM 20547]QQB63221.1 nucleotidyl transferase AbiEii/AbiGii toxin family protein [Kytococcus sedentarius]STX13909.1 Nucleotidyl transferase of uncharacterised function (DUF1814) [Kytococcus sedentarius]